jgi:signal transduction histidine kinase/ActR/RegA family two-component response regulator
MRIRSRLLVLVLVVLVPAVIASALELRHAYQEQRRSREATLRETARALSLALNRELSRREAILRTLAAAPDLREENIEHFRQFALEVADARDGTIILSDLDGQQLVNTRLPPGTPLPRMLEAERRLRERYGREMPLVSNVYKPPLEGGPYSFAIQVPVRRDGQVTGFLTLASFTRQLQVLLEEQRLPAGWHASIVDRDGIVAARSAEPDKYVGQPVRPELLQAMRHAPEGFHEGNTLEGRPSAAFFSRSQPSDWTFVIAVPSTELDGGAWRAVAVMAVMSAVLLGGGGLLAIGFARSIVRPIEALRRSAEQLGRQEEIPATRHGFEEADAVQKALVNASTQLREMNAQLELRVAEAVSKYEQSQRALQQAQKLEALGRLTGGIAHDFNNVLQTMTTSLQTALRMAPDNMRELLLRCQRAVGRGTDLARQLMVFGRVQEVRSQTIASSERLHETVPMLRGALPSNIELQVEIEPHLWPVTVDPAQLELALLNFVINARDAMPSGGTITLRARNRTLPSADADGMSGDVVGIEVSDTGEGMSEAVMAHAMEPFYTTKRVGKGSGMGLPQAYGFARQSGGSLRLESAVGQGTTVTLLLPRTAAQPSARPADNPQTAARAAQGSGRVLLVEDDDLVRDTVSAALRTAGFDVDDADTGDEAWRRIEAGEAYDAVLTDVVMPGALSGLDLARLLRERYPRIGVVVATGYSDRSVHVPGVRTLPKPYDVEQAVDELNAALQSTQPRGSSHANGDDPREASQ